MVQSGDDPSGARLLDVIERNRIIRSKPPPSLLHALMLSLAFSVETVLEFESQIRRNRCPHPAVVPKFAAAALAKRKFLSCARAWPLLRRKPIVLDSGRNCIARAWFRRELRC